MKALKTCPCCKSIYPLDLEIEELEDTVCLECGVSQSIDSKFQERQLHIFQTKCLPILTDYLRSPRGIKFMPDGGVEVIV